MATEASPEIPPAATLLSFSEIMNYYFATENALYEERSRNANRWHDSTATTCSRCSSRRLDEYGRRNPCRRGLPVCCARGASGRKRTLWIRTTASQLKDTRLLSLLSASLLLGCAVSFIAYEILDTDWSPALLSGLAVIRLRFCLPWFMDILATHDERKLRALRRIEDPHVESI
jgi:hypothetical protein